MTLIALVDANSFYASCETIFNPRLEGTPVIVLSNNDGCIVARSAEAKAIGFAMGEPYHLARERIEKHKVRTFSSNYALYGDLSRRVMQTLEMFAPELEVYSIDEAFLRLDGFQGVDLTAYGRSIRATVRQHTGVPVSVGVATSKTLAKIANRLAKASRKTGGVLDLSASAYLDLALERTEIGDVWGIGRASTRKLNAIGIMTALDLKLAQPKTIRKLMGVVGERIVHELNGISCLPLELMRPKRQCIAVSRSFGRRLRTLDEVKEALTAYVHRAGEKLRRERLMAAFLSVSIETNAFDEKGPRYANSAGGALEFPTDYAPDLMAAAMRGIEAIFRPGLEYQRCGVMLQGLEERDDEKQSLFDERDRNRQRSLMSAMDAVNRDFGAGTLRFARMRAKPAGAMRQNMKSPHFTTRWSDLPRARVDI